MTPERKRGSENSVEVLLTADELREIIQELFVRFFEQEGAYGLIVTKPQVSIEEDQLEVHCEVSLKVGIFTVVLLFDYTLVNGSADKLAVAELEVEARGKSFALGVLRSLYDIPAMTRRVLNNLDQEIIEHPPRQVRERGLAIKSLKLKLQADKLKVVVKAK